MRIFLFLLILSSAALADDFDQKMDEIHKQKDEALFHWRVQNRFDEATLTPASKAEAYKDFVTKMEKETLAKELKLHEESCAATKTHCLNIVDESKKVEKVTDHIDVISKKVEPIIDTTPQKESKPIVTPDKKPEDEKPVILDTKKEEKKPVETATENEDEKSPRNYRAETCRWVSDLPRRLVSAPGCSVKSRTVVCTGYVVCDQIEGGGKFVRMSTCAADKCGDDDAVSCTKDPFYFSATPTDETRQFVTPKLKQILSGEQ